MLYLLPQEQKKKVLREYRMRLAIVALVAASCVGVVSLVSILPTKVLVSVHQDILSLQNRNVEGQSLANVDELSKKIANISNTAAFLNPLSRPLSNVSIISRLESEAGNNTNITQFQLNHVDENLSIQISGVSKNRDTLTKFINTLKQDPAFSGAVFPYSSLAKQDNLEFNLNLTIDEDKLNI